MTKIKFLASLAVLVLLLTLPAVALAQVQPPRPAVFGGTVTMDGATAADGTVVDALIDGNVVASTTVAGGAYAITIAQPPGESFGGKIVFFAVAGSETPERGTWQDSGGSELNLTASSSMMMMRGPAIVGMAWAGLNQYLVDRNGMSLYLFTADTQGVDGGNPTSACTSEKCMNAWPIYTTEGDPVATGRTRAKNLGTYEHPSGVTQVTYNGNPLYYYNRDKNPGDVIGQYTAWHLVSRDGNLLLGGTTADSASMAKMMGAMMPDGGAGPAGKTGPAGPGGVAGPGGAKGDKGAAGAAGAAGKGGAAGNDGASGRAGSAGVKGDQGNIGPAGSVGPSGAAGAAGQPGASGGGALGVIALIIAIVAVIGAGGAIVMGRRT